MKAYIISIVIVMLLLSQRFAVAQGNLIVNGGFDIDASGWTTNGPPGYWGASWESGGNPGGNISVSWSTSQDISGLIPGFNYLVSWSCIGDSLTALSVDINDVSMFVVQGEIDPSWKNFSFVYNATSSSINLAFVNETSIGDTYNVDNVSLKSVPEPSALSLFVICALALFFCWRNKCCTNCSSKF